jgi:hypothetical protein
MPEFLPLGAFRQGLLPGECRSCAWWQTNGNRSYRGEEAERRRHEWMTGLEPDWGYVGLLVPETSARRGATTSPDVIISGSVHFAPASALARFRELPFPSLPPHSALLFCLHVDDDAPRWLPKRLIRKALYELRARGVREVYAIAHWPEGSGSRDDCRFFPSELLLENGFEQISHNEDLCLMRVDNRGLVALIDQVEAAVRRVFANEPAPSPAAWVQGENKAEQGAR